MSNTRSGTITTDDKATIWYEVHGDDKPKNSVPLLMVSRTTHP